MFFCVFIALFVIFGLVRAYWWHGAEYFLFIFFFFFLVGLYDIFQRKHNVLRNYPIIGHLRYLLLFIRPEMQQYFIETEQSGRPFNSEMRNSVYRRSSFHYTLKHFGKLRYTIPFGTQLDVYAPGYEWFKQSLKPTKLPDSASRIVVGGPDCRQPYEASRLNISAMSFGAISKHAIRALNRGAKHGNFAHNTGEGSLTPYHLQEGGDIIWQIGTANFGCRTKDGRFCAEQFKEKAAHPHVKMIEIKLSQGAKPGHGGVLPAAKITPEIAKIRGIEMGADCDSPAANPEFSTPRQLLGFVDKLRNLSDGKPIGLKICLGSPLEFLCLCKAMLEMKIYPDFITVDGAEGGTGAAPPEFSDAIGMPLLDALAFVQFALVGTNLRQYMRLIVSGKIVDGISMARVMALGADMCNSARGMMFSLGCIQSLKCNTNMCPTGIATQNPKRMYALNVDDKAPKVAGFQAATIRSFLDVLGAMGLSSVDDIGPSHICRRTESSGYYQTYHDIYPMCQPGDILKGNVSKHRQAYWKAATSEHFISAQDAVIDQ